MFSHSSIKKAKTPKRLFLCVLTAFLASAGNFIIPASEMQAENICASPAAIVVCEAKSEVYICTGPKARVYHNSSRCKGLRRCSGTIKKVSLEKARAMHRRPCRICVK